MYKNLKPCSTGIKRLFFLFVASLCFFGFSFAQNPIADENKLAGTPASVWDIPDASAGDPSIQGYADNISVNVGGTIHFKVDVNTGANKSYNISIYRLGYYGGAGARLIQNLGTSTGVAQDDNPANACTFDNVTGLVDCGKWVVTSTWTVPGTAVSGLYIAKLTRPASAGGGTSHIPFVVRNDTSTAGLYFKTSDATWQAYNGYGGYSLYVGANMDFNHANKVSYNRPFKTREGGGGGGAHEDWLMTSEYPMIRFLESNGYNISYTTDVDVARNNANNINLLLNHRVFLSVGHDEYWSKEERNSVEAAKAAGKNLAFFSGNEVYWKTRWENSVDGTNTPFRTMVCYKEGTLPTPQENACQEKCDLSTNEWTGLWRDGCNYPGVTDACKPENALSGQISWDGTTGGIDVPETYKNLRFWRNTPDVASLSGGEYDLPVGTLGYEWDWEQYESSYPPGRVTMSSTLFDGHTHKLSLYKDQVSKALVFGAGTVQWAWGLDENHDVNSQGGGGPADQNMQQATINVLADMGAQPATLQSPLVAAVQSTDVTPAKSVISTPINGAVISQGSIYTISGTATDVGGVVAGVDISVDGGVTWHPATGSDTWTYSWTPTVAGNYTIKSRAFDDIGNIEAPGGGEGASNTVSVTVTTPAPPADCPCGIFTPVQGPGAGDLGNIDENQAVTLGVKFRAGYAGTISAIRFYKDPGDIGTNTVQLWDLEGNLLGSGTGTGPTGWVTIPLQTAVSIEANKTYVASYYSSLGYYAATENGFSDEVTNGALTGIATDDEDGPNGVYTYSPLAAEFPASTYNATNYWVDVVYTPDGTGPDTTPPEVSFTSPSNAATDVNVNGFVSVTFNENIEPSTVNTSTIELSSGGTPVPATVAYTVNSRTATLIPTSSLEFAANYTVTVKGGVTDPRIKDLAGNALAGDFTATFTTAEAPPVPPDEGNGGPVLIISSITDLFSRYPVEILRAEGYNAFDAKDIDEVRSDPSLLNNYDVIILGHISMTGQDVTTFSNWTTAGGTLITLRPDASLAPLLGITPAGGTLSDRYLLVNTSAGLPGAGIVNQTIQFHSDADLYTLSGATSLATLYSDANTATSNPAITTNNVGTLGGKAIAFTYDLARSVVYTRQGNPAWAGTSRDSQEGPIRSDNLFFPDYIDFNKIAIPQADEQQHLLTNIILLSNLHRKPLPHLWFLPNGFKAAVIMTGDDHAVGNTQGRFEEYMTMGPNTPQDVADWKAVRGTSYLLTGTPLRNDSVAYFQDQGFELALHPNTICLDFTPASLNSTFTTQLQEIKNEFPSMTAPVTNRTHCMPWSDWATHPKIESSLGIRFDVNYYYWPGTWVQNRPGMFTGSGMPMRFADLNGSIIDCYQAPTQMPDESELDIPFNINSLLDSALGPQGYYGAFVMNMHTDQAIHPGSDQIIASAQARGVPVISAKQMLTWLDTRNNTIFGPMTWDKVGATPRGDSVLSFTMSTVAHNLQAMLPLNSSTGSLVKVTEGGGEIGFTPQTIKGISYGVFNAVTGSYIATYSSTALPITLLSFTVTKQGANDALLKWTTSMEQNNKGFEIQRSSNVSDWTVIGFVNGRGNSQTKIDYKYPDKDLANGTYYYRLRQVDYDGKSTFSKIVSVTIDGATALELLQNRPNPFTTSTTIEIVIPQSCRAQLILYDQMGRPVQQLMDELKSPGKYQVEVNKSGLSSGTYYYKLNALGQSLVRKMTIL